MVTQNVSQLSDGIWVAVWTWSNGEADESSATLRAYAETREGALSALRNVSDELQDALGCEP